MIINSKGRVLDFTTGSVIDGSGGETLTEDHRVIELEGMFKEAYGIMYIEYTYTSESISRIDVWNSSGKSIKLFTKTFTYGADGVSSIVLVDEISRYRLTTSYTYSNGSIVSKNKVMDII